MSFDTGARARRLAGGLRSIRGFVSAARGSLAHVEVGRHTYGVHRWTIMGATASAPVTIGSFCSFARDVTLLCHVGHRLDLPSTFPFRSRLFGRPAGPGELNADAVTRGPIRIGHDVWVGYRATILSGVTIGTGAVVAAGSIVTRDIEPYAIVAGNPARLVRYRFEPGEISALLSSKWWELPDRSLIALEPELYRTDIAAFVAAVSAQRALLVGA